jgi:hypothetical protein
MFFRREEALVGLGRIVYVKNVTSSTLLIGFKCICQAGTCIMTMQPRFIYASALVSYFIALSLATLDLEPINKMQ